MEHTVDYAEVLLESVQKLIDNAIDSYKVDTNEVCTVLTVPADISQPYQVTLNGVQVLEAYADNLHYAIGEEVLVTFPKDDTKRKTILSSYKTEDENAIAFVTPNERFAEIDFYETEEDLTLSTEQLNATYLFTIESTAEGIGNLFSQINVFNALYLKTTIQTNFDLDNLPAAGDYGLAINIMCKDSIENTQSFRIRAQDMLGNPYAFKDGFEQEFLFPLSIPKDIALEKIEVYAYYNDEFIFPTAVTEALPIIFKNIHIGIGFNMDQVEDNAVITYATSDLTYNKKYNVDKEGKISYEDNNKIMRVVFLNKDGDNRYIGFRGAQYNPTLAKRKRSTIVSINQSPIPNESDKKEWIVMLDGVDTLYRPGNVEYNDNNTNTPVPPKDENENPLAVGDIVEYELESTEGSELLNFKVFIDLTAAAVQEDGTQKDIPNYYTVEWKADNASGNLVTVPEASIGPGSKPDENVIQQNTTNVYGTEATIQGHSSLSKIRVAATVWYNGTAYTSNELDGKSLVNAGASGSSTVVESGGLKIKHGVYSQPVFDLYDANTMAMISSSAAITRQVEFYYEPNNLVPPEMWDGTVLTWEKSGSHILADSPSQTTLYYIGSADKIAEKTADAETYAVDGKTITIAGATSKYYYVRPEGNGYKPLAPTSSNNLKAGTFINNTYSYKLNEFFNPADTVGSIKCKAVIPIQGGGATEAEAELTFTFTSYGLSGTNYNMIFTRESDTELTVKVVDRDGNDISVSEYSCNSPFTCDKNNDKCTITIPSTLSSSTYNLLTVKAAVKFNNMTVKIQGYYSVWTPLDTWQDYSATVPYTVVYNNQNTNPQYSQSQFRLYNKSEEDSTIGAEVTGITWSLRSYGGLKDATPLVTITEENILKASSLYVENAPTVALEAKSSGSPSTVLVNIPIYIGRNAHGSQTLNDWDGGLLIDEQNNYILAAMVGAGRKDTNNTFTGVIMGERAKLNESQQIVSSDVGLFGFDRGVQTYEFNTDGSAYIGKAGAGQIRFDGNEGTISSMGWSKNSNNKYTLSSKGQGGSILDVDNAILMLQQNDNNGNDQYHLHFNNGGSGNFDLKVNSSNVNLADKGVDLDEYTEGIVSEVRRGATYYAVCSTPTGTTKKTITLADIVNKQDHSTDGVTKIGLTDILSPGTTLAVTFTNKEEITDEYTSTTNQTTGQVVVTKTSKGSELYLDIIEKNMSTTDEGEEGENTTTNSGVPIYLDAEPVGEDNAFGWSAGATVYFVYTQLGTNDYCWRVTDSGAFSRITQTADSIVASVNSVSSGVHSQIIQEADKIRSEVSHAAGFVATCDTASANYEKEIELVGTDQEWPEALKTGMRLAVTFTNKTDNLGYIQQNENVIRLQLKCGIFTNPVRNDTNPESTNTNDILDSLKYSWVAGETVYFIYNDGYWQLTDAGSYSRITQTFDAIKSEVQRSVQYSGIVKVASNNSTVKTVYLQSFEKPIKPSELYQTGITIAVTFKGDDASTTGNLQLAMDASSFMSPYTNDDIAPKDIYFEDKLISATNKPFTWKAGNTEYFTYDATLSSGSGGWNISGSGSYSYIKQTADGIKSQVRNLEGTLTSEIEQTATRIQASVARVANIYATCDTAADITPKKIKLSATDAKNLLDQLKKQQTVEAEPIQQVFYITFTSGNTVPKYSFALCDSAGNVLKGTSSSQEESAETGENEIEKIDNSTIDYGVGNIAVTDCPSWQARESLAFQYYRPVNLSDNESIKYQKFTLTSLSKAQLKITADSIITDIQNSTGYGCKMRELTNDEKNKASLQLDTGEEGWICEFQSTLVKTIGELTQAGVTLTVIPEADGACKKTMYIALNLDANYSSWYPVHFGDEQVSSTNEFKWDKKFSLAFFKNSDKSLYLKVVDEGASSHTIQTAYQQLTTFTNDYNNRLSAFKQDLDEISAQVSRYAALTATDAQKKDNSTISLKLTDDSMKKIIEESDISADQLNGNETDGYSITLSFPDQIIVNCDFAKIDNQNKSYTNLTFTSNSITAQLTDDDNKLITYTATITDAIFPIDPVIPWKASEQLPFQFIKYEEGSTTKWKLVPTKTSNAELDVRLDAIESSVKRSGGYACTATVADSNKPHTYTITPVDTQNAPSPLEQSGVTIVVTLPNDFWTYTEFTGTAFVSGTTYYEKSGSNYIPTKDKEINANKTYYTASAEAVQFNGTKVTYKSTQISQDNPFPWKANDTFYFSYKGGQEPAWMLVDSGAQSLVTSTADLWQSELTNTQGQISSIAQTVDRITSKVGVITYTGYTATSNLSEPSKDRKLHTIILDDNKLTKEDVCQAGRQLEIVFNNGNTVQKNVIDTLVLPMKSSPTSQTPMPYAFQVWYKDKNGALCEGLYALQNNTKLYFTFVKDTSTNGGYWLVGGGEYSVLQQTKDNFVAQVMDGGNGFGWNLTSTEFKLYTTDETTIPATKKTVFQCDKDGVTVTGNINATSGSIGSWNIVKDSLFDSNILETHYKKGDAYYGIGLRVGTLKNYIDEGNINPVFAIGKLNNTWYSDYTYDKPHGDWLTANFYVNADGALHATGADISGKVTITTGTFENLTAKGSLKIGAQKIYFNNNSGNDYLQYSAESKQLAWFGETFQAHDIQCNNLNCIETATITSLIYQGYTIDVRNGYLVAQQL